jgi:hypothetical protein
MRRTADKGNGFAEAGSVDPPAARAARGIALVATVAAAANTNSRRLGFIDKSSGRLEGYFKAHCPQDGHLPNPIKLLCIQFRMHCQSALMLQARKFGFEFQTHCV